MRYFDTDVLVHYFVAYDEEKHQQATQLVGEAVKYNSFYFSLLSVQETSFAMSKLKESLENINRAVTKLLLAEPIGYDVDDFRRAYQIAQHLGFKNINDCLHTALAESNGCDELITYNRKDFVRIKPLSSLNIIIL